MKLPTQAEQLILKLRELLLSGHFQPGERMMEIPLSQMLGVSRTPLRLALAALAQEGLLTYASQRGFVVRGFTIKEIVDAIDVRGQIEAMACRLVAQQRLASAELESIESNLARTTELTRRNIELTDERIWSGLNGEFHETFVRMSGNESLRRVAQQLNSMPLVAARAQALTAATAGAAQESIAQALEMHLFVFDAVKNRQPERAQALMQEHIYQARERLRVHLEGILNSGEARRPPLVRVGESPLIRRRRRKSPSAAAAPTKTFSS